MNKYQKGFAPIIIALIVLILAGVGGTGYYLIKQSSKQTACTLEAKICPDGSSIGRTGPNCEFAACPEAKADETINNQDFLLTIIGNSLVIEDKKTGDLVQTIPFSDEKCISTDYWKSRAASFTDDINFDGYKDLFLCDTVGMKDFYGYYWIYNPIIKKFEKDEGLETLGGQYEFDSTKKEISDTYYLGCAGLCYGGKTLSFIDGKYLLTYKWDINYDSSREQYIKTTKELKNGKWETKEAIFTPPNL